MWEPVATRLLAGTLGKGWFVCLAWLVQAAPVAWRVVVESRWSGSVQWPAAVAAAASCTGPVNIGPRGTSSLPPSSLSPAVIAGAHDSVLCVRPHDFSLCRFIWYHVDVWKAHVSIGFRLFFLPEVSCPLTGRTSCHFSTGICRTTVSVGLCVCPVRVLTVFLLSVLLPPLFPTLLTSSHHTAPQGEEQCSWTHTPSSPYCNFNIRCIASPQLLCTWGKWQQETYLPPWKMLPCTCIIYPLYILMFTCTYYWHRNQVLKEA